MTGTERKVFQKYYPPDFDPTKLPRAKQPKNRQWVQRVMTPFNMRCNTCNEYIYKGKKFNMKREPADEFYLGIRIWRFYFRCPNCLAEISFKTDLENCDYQAENGATRLFEAFKLWKDQEKAKEAKEEEDKNDPMKQLEKRTKMSRAEMEAMGKLDEILEVNRRHEGASASAIDSFYHTEANTEEKLTMAEQLRRQEGMDEILIRQLFGRAEDGKLEKRIKDEDDEEWEGPGMSRSLLAEDVKDVKRVKLNKLEPADAVKKRNSDQKSLLSKIVVTKKPKKEMKTEPPDDYGGEEGDSGAGPGPSTSSSGPPAGPSSSTPGAAPGASILAGLAAYGSGSDSD